MLGFHDLINTMLSYTQLRARMSCNLDACFNIFSQQWNYEKVYHHKNSLLDLFQIETYLRKYF